MKTIIISHTEEIYNKISNHFLYNKNDYEPDEIAWMEVEDFYKQFEVGDYDEQVY